MDTFTRRSFLRSGAVATTAAMLGLRPWAAAPAVAAAPYLIRSSWAGLIQQSVAAGYVELRLQSISDVAGARDRSLAGTEDAFVSRSPVRSRRRSSRAPTS